MKKLFKCFSLIFILFLTTINVNATNYPYAWDVGGETIYWNKSNAAGSASWSTDSNYKGGILTLNNYNGGGISIDCYGTGVPDMVFAVRLVGDNKITSTDGIGVNGDSPIVFIGDGSLTVDAPTPIRGSYKLGLGGGGMLNINQSQVETQNDDTSNASNDIQDNSDTDIITAKVQDDKNNDKNDDISCDDENSEIKKYINLGVSVYIIISLIVIIILLVKNKKLKSNKVA